MREYRDKDPFALHIDKYQALPGSLTIVIISLYHDYTSNQGANSQKCVLNKRNPNIPKTFFLMCWYVVNKELFI